MPKTLAFAIELDDEPAGLVVQQRSGFLFVASNRRFAALDGRLFRSVAQAERACRAAVTAPRPQRATAAG